MNHKPNTDPEMTQELPAPGSWSVINTYRGPQAALLNAWAAEIHTANAHFYTDLDTGQRFERNIGELNALIHSEVSEMLEGARKGEMDKHLPHRLNEEVEAADIFIRLLDYCGYRGLDLGGAVIEKFAYNRTRHDHSNAARRAKGGKKF